MHYQEDHENETTGLRFGDSEAYPLEDSVAETPQDLLRFYLRKEGYRCTGKVYADRPDGAVHVGWHLQKRERYEDSGETYLHGLWLTFHELIPCGECGHMLKRSVDLSKTRKAV